MAVFSFLGYMLLTSLKNYWHQIQGRMNCFTESVNLICACAKHVHNAGHLGGKITRCDILSLTDFLLQQKSQFYGVISYLMQEISLSLLETEALTMPGNIFKNEEMAVTIPKYSEDNCQPKLEHLDINHPFSSQADLPIQDQINRCNYKITHSDTQSASGK